MSKTLLPLIAITVLIFVLGLGYSYNTKGAATSAQNSTSNIVVYLTGTPSNGELTPQALQANLGAIQTYQWQDVVNIQSITPIDVLIVDSGSLSLVDWDWIAQPYRFGLILVAINVHLSQLGQQLNEQVFADHPQESWSGEFYAVGHSCVNGTPAALTAVAQDPNHSPTGSDWVTEYLDGDELSTGPSTGANIEPGTTAYFYRRIAMELRQQELCEAGE